MAWLVEEPVEEGLAVELVVEPAHRMARTPRHARLERWRRSHCAEAGPAHPTATRQTTNQSGLSSSHPDQ